MTKLPIVFVLLLITACATSSPKLYTLELMPGAAYKSGLRVLSVRSVGVPRYLDRPEIVSAAGSGRMAASDEAWWTEPMRVMLRRVLMDNLGQRLPGTIVLSAEGAIGGPADADVQIEMQRFERNEAGFVLLTGTLAIERLGRARTLDPLRIVVPAAGPGTLDQVGAMSAALAQVADLVAARLTA